MYRVSLDLTRRYVRADDDDPVISILKAVKKKACIEFPVAGLEFGNGNSGLIAVSCLRAGHEGILC